MNLYQITKKYLGTKFNWGGRSPSEGLDCFNLMLSIQKDLGKLDPQKFQFKTEGLTWENYRERIKNASPEEINQMIQTLIDGHFTPVPDAFSFVGDIAIMNDKGRLILGTVMGNSQILLISPDKGVIPVRILELSQKYSIKYYRYKE